jgi:hypothetical protein
MRVSSRRSSIAIGKSSDANRSWCRSDTLSDQQRADKGQQYNRAPPPSRDAVPRSFLVHGTCIDFPNVAAFTTTRVRLPDIHLLVVQASFSRRDVLTDDDVVFCSFSRFCDGKRKKVRPLPFFRSNSVVAEGTEGKGVTERAQTNGNVTRKLNMMSASHFHNKKVTKLSWESADATMKQDGVSTKFRSS